MRQLLGDGPTRCLKMRYGITDWFCSGRCRERIINPDLSPQKFYLCQNLTRSWILLPITNLDVMLVQLNHSLPVLQYKHTTGSHLITSIQFNKLTCPFEIRFTLPPEGNRGGTVVKVLRYKSEGRWFDPGWCQWIFHCHKILPIALWSWGRFSL
jgi:hypothetical protein